MPRAVCATGGLVKLNIEATFHFGNIRSNNNAQLNNKHTINDKFNNKRFATLLHSH